MAAIQNESKIPVGAILVGKYRVTREIGRGGMAAVYEALHISLNKRIAIKVLAAELSASTVVIERFFREARAAASVKSPYIVDVYDSGRLEDGRPFIAMELLEGESLYDRMARVRIIDVPTTIRVVSHCSRGLMKAHAAGIVHRDLKPENIFLTHGEGGEEVVKLLDFGLAKFYAPVHADEKTARLTREGAVFGTPAYMSPEQVKGQGSVDHRADLWAIGCIAYECLIGRPVWNTDQGVAMTFAAIAASAIPIPSKQRPDLPPSFDEWFAKALERDVAHRFQNSKELSEAFARAMGAGLLPSTAEGEDALSFVPPDPSQLSPASGRVEWSTPTRPRGSSRGSDARQSQDAGAFLAPGSGGGFAGGGETPPNSQGAAAPFTSPPPAFRSTWTRYVISVVSLAVAGASSYIAWANYLRPQVLAPLVHSTAALPTSSAATTGSELPAPTEGEPKWAETLGDGQRLFSAGDFVGAARKFKDAQDQGVGAARAFQDEIKLASSPAGPCKIAAFSHPRLGISGSAARPSVASGARGGVVVWTDDHEQQGHDHVYSVVIDAAGTPRSRPRDLTPEASEVGRPSLLEVGERTLLLYWDRGGHEPGVRVRWLDAEGRIAGASVLVGGARPGAYWPAIDRAPDGFYVTWQDDRDKIGSELYLRHLNSELQPTAPEIRATDYTAGKGKVQPQVRLPSIAVASNAIYDVYKLERDHQNLILLMRAPLTLPTLATGLDEKPGMNPDGGRADRELGDVEIVNEDHVGGDAPQIACGTEGCFLVWHGEQAGAYAALVEPVQGRVLWRKKFAPGGAHPAIAVSQEGQVEVAYVEKGLVRVAGLSRDGVGASSSVGHIAGGLTEPARPTIATGGVKGEWYVAWQDGEGGRGEVFTARVTCH